MRIVVAPNAFKGTLTAQQVCGAIKSGLSVSAARTQTEISLFPMADGGDGSLPTVVELLGGYYESASVSGPNGARANCRWGVLNRGNTLFIETALIFGLSLLHPKERNPYFTSSRGIGEAILHGLNSGVQDFLIGVGGSANNDAGTGMLKALGCSFLDSEGVELPDGGIYLKHLKKIDLRGLDSRLISAQLTFLSDSSVPLVGEDGVSIMYSEGKGASAEMAVELDLALKHYASVFFDTFGYDYSREPGSGSGGGVVSAGKHFLQADDMFGSDYFIDLTQVEEAICSADLVITGEGMVCEQTVYHKAPISVAKLAKKYGIKVLSVNALLGKRHEVVFDHGIDAILHVKPVLGGVVSPSDISNAIETFANECSSETGFRLDKKIYCYE